MHCLNLGVGQHINAQILLDLIKAGRYQRGGIKLQLRVAWVRFKAWAKVQDLAGGD